MTRRLTIDDLADIAVPEQPAISPDGSEIAYVLRTVDEEQDRVSRALWLVGAADGAPRALTRGHGDSSPAWSPDGNRIAFLRATDGPAQLWVLPTAGGEPEQLTTLPLGAGTPVWSPDGSRLAFTAPVDLHATPDDDDRARTRRRSAPIVTDRVDYQADGAGYLRTIRQHVHVLDPDDRSCRQLTDGDWHAGDPSWSPDGTTLAFAAAADPDADLTMRAPMHLIDVAGSPAAPRRVGPVDIMASGGQWAADGAALFVTATTDGPVGHTRLLRLAPLTGAAQPVDLAAALDRNVMPGGPGYPGALPRLHADGSRLLFCARDNGCTQLYDVPVDGGDIRSIVAGPGLVVSGLSVAGNTAAIVLGTPDSFGEIVAIDLDTGQRRVRTQHGEQLADIALFDREERQFAISDGTVIHGWITRDPDRPGPLPLLLDIHGGPHNAWNGAADEAHVYQQVLAARGWAVATLNPRGSDGYGEEFFDAVLAGWGTSDARDFLEPIDQLVAEGLADADRLAVTGYSYGGFMTCYLTSRDDRFAAAVAGGVVSDLVSMAGTSDAGHFLSEHELGGQPWIGGAAVREAFDRMSPLTRVEAVRTPTLIVHGAADVRCPVGQAQQWHTALRERGVPTRMVLYPDASHLFVLTGRPSHRRDWNQRVVDWVEQYASDPTGPRPARIDGAHWQRRLATLAERHRVPGASLGILRLSPAGDDEVVTAAYGVLNKETGAAATADALFQIGSMSKVWTATVIMQLVDEGALDLDAPVVDVLPELALADPDVTARVTMRHLLTHTSGIDGDIFDDTGRGDDCLEKYTALLERAGQNHPLGATWSYCNSGFSLAGRVIERITGQSWDQAMRERLFAPLGLTRTATLPEEVLLHAAAVGHVAEGDAEPERAPAWMLPRSLGPAGLICSTPGDVLAFARMHLAGGVAPDGTRLLSEETVAAMMSHQADLPDKYSLGDSWGIGWIRFGWDGHRLVGHDGNTIGQAAFLRILPEQNLAVTLLTNGGNGRDLYEDLYREIFADVAGVTMASPLTPPAEPVTADISPHVGRYERASVIIEILANEDGPVMRTTTTGPLAELLPDPVEEYPMVALSDDLYLVRPPAAETWSPVTFYRLPSGERYLHFGVRATPKVA